MTKRKSEKVFCFRFRRAVASAGNVASATQSTETTRFLLRRSNERRWALRKLICKIERHDDSKTIPVKVICFRIRHGCIILHTMFYNAVHLHMQYYSFANTILKCAAFQFFTPAKKPTVNFYLRSSTKSFM